MPFIALRRLLSAAIALILGAMPIVQVLPAYAATPQPIVSLPRALSGQAAIAALGPALPAVAASHGKSADALARAFSKDKTLFVDPKGRLFYREAAATPAEVAAAGVPQPATVPLSDTFTLHSRPGAKRVIFLDFDGATLTGTAWNGGTVPDPLVCPPFDTDGSPTTFSDAERTVIQQVWQRVAEDYAPFDLDVTTADPGEDAMLRTSQMDYAYGVRVLISPLSSYFGNAGGIAYVGAFDTYGGTYKPALIFPEKLANNERYIGEACSHEAGHTLGLLHDGTTAGAEYYTGQGTGATGWAPIMGNGYYKPVTQWSRGEYALANNTEDDLAVIPTHGCAARTDDHGDTAAAATMRPAASTVAANGVVERTGDVDVIGFNTGAGTVSLSVAPAPRGPDLDVALELRDAAGDLVASADPTSTLTASLSAVVSAGTYYLSVRGAGCGDPVVTGYSSYGSLGNWALTGTVPAPTGNLPPVATIAAPADAIVGSSVVFDGSGSSDPDGSVVSWAWDFGDGASGSGANVTHAYAAAGTYMVRLTVTDNTGSTASATTTLSVGKANTAPTAVISAPSGLVAGTAGAFSGSASSDPDGSVVSWAWDFGDGTTGTGASASHAYAAAGTYTVRLTVTDDAGASAAASATVTVAARPLLSMHVSAITVTSASTKAGKVAYASVKVVDANGAPVSGATVTGNWSGPITGTSSAITDANGVALLKSKTFKKTGTVTLAVTQVAKSGYAYDATANAVTKASLAFGTAPRQRRIR